ncbi:response regulator [Arenibaculum sp.]|uniref:response regulator transcription factor n=1 Tax=Arenibaculum sp. TaxID=2865862 RepID=UPI002E14E0C6|nr:response regulator [Arenibaculum sp.]
MERTVLVVDDSKLARMVVNGIVRRTRPDWNTVEAASAGQALQILGNGSVDIVLIDFNMPEMDGLALTARIRESHPDVPIAIVSANAQDPIIAKARSLDAAFLEKPLNDEALASFLSGAALRLRRGSS